MVTTGSTCTGRRVANLALVHSMPGVWLLESIGGNKKVFLKYIGVQQWERVPSNG